MTAASVTAENEWAGAQLRARRTAAGLTQAQVAERAGIDRSRYNALETGRHALTPTYAERIAPVLGLKDPSKLLPPPPPKPDGHLRPAAGSPLDLLRELSATVDDLQTTNEALLKRVESLERALSTRRRASGAG